MDYNIVVGILDRLGYKTIPNDYYNDQKRWLDWYHGTVSKFHKVIIDTGVKKLEYNRYKAGMAQQVCQDWADLLFNENVVVTLGQDKENQVLEDVFEYNNFHTKMNEMQEAKAAYGTCAYVPHVTGAVIDDCGTPTGQMAAIDIDYITGDSIFPLSWHNGIIRECCFASEYNDERDNYVLLQLHVLAEDKTYHILNRLFKQESKTGMYNEIPLNSIQDFENVQPEILTGTNRPQFVIDKLAIRAPKEYGPMGIAVFAGATDQLKSIDISYDSYVNEFILGKKRIMVKLGAMKDAYTGEPVFDSGDLVYYALPEDGMQESFIKEIDMNLRTEAHSKGLQDMLNMFSHRCGLGIGYYRFDEGDFKTATHVISSNSKLYRTIKKHEIPLERVISDLSKIILHLANKYGNAGLNEDVEVSVSFDDSIVEDKNSEFLRDIQMVEANAMAPWELRMRYLGESEEEARANVPQAEKPASENENPEEKEANKEENPLEKYADLQ